MSNFPKPLPAARQLELVRRAQRGDKSARDLLVTSNMAFVYSEARKFTSRSPEMEIDDLAQEGATGLMHAIDKFDPAAGVLFLTYAGHWVRQRMGRACAQDGSVARYGARIPDAVYHAMPRVARFQSAHEREQGRSCSAEEIAEALELSLDCVEQALRLLTAPPLTDVEDDETRDWLMDRPDPDADTVAEAADSEQRKVIDRLMEQLPLDERRVIVRRFGLDGDGAVSEKELGAEMGVNRAKLQSLRAQALKRLRESPLTTRLTEQTSAGSQYEHLTSSTGHVRAEISQEQLAKVSRATSIAGQDALMGTMGGLWWSLSRPAAGQRWQLAVTDGPDGELMALPRALRTLRGPALTALVEFAAKLPLDEGNVAYA